MGTFAHALNPNLNPKLPYDPHQDFAPVALIARSFNIVVVDPKSPIKSIAELIAAAKADSAKLSYGKECRRPGGRQPPNSGSHFSLSHCSNDQFPLGTQQFGS
jgi:tripartite-type tricarboxylate transporter receptor subunit TctC